MKYFVGSQKGQTLAEIIVVLGIVLLLVTSLISGSTGALRTSDQSKLRSSAVSLGQEAMEKVRQMRDESWATFQSKSGLWCLDKAGVWTQASGICLVNVDGIFTRGVTFSWNAGAERMEVTTTVSWQDAGATHQSTLITFFTQWQ